MLASLSGALAALHEDRHAPLSPTLAAHAARILASAGGTAAGAKIDDDLRRLLLGAHLLHHAFVLDLEGISSVADARRALPRDPLALAARLALPLHDALALARALAGASSEGI